jgi:dihydrolipoamide dehydrogenase
MKSREESVQSFDLAVIGSGSGLIVMERALALGLKVAVIEKSAFGGTCLNRGCIPSKMLVYPADLVRDAQMGKRVGVTFQAREVDWAVVTRNMREQIDENIALERDLSHTEGLTLYKGEARFLDAHTLAVRLNAGGEERLSAKMIVVGVGGRTRVPKLPGLSEVGYVTSESFFGDRFPHKPWDSLLLIGGGATACEMAHVFSAFGTKVTMAVRSETILRGFDAEIGPFVSRGLEHAGVRVLYFAQAQAATMEDGLKTISFIDKQTNEPYRVSAQEIFVASGIVPNTDALNLPAAGVVTDQDGYIVTDERMATTVPHIWALGDVNGKYQLRHKANYEAGILNDNLYGEGMLKARYDSVPRAVFTHPQAASVGMSEYEAKALHGDGVRVYINHYSSVVAGRAMGYRKSAEDDGFAKIVCAENGRILGAHIAGPQAAALVQPYAYLMHAGGPEQAESPGTWLPVARAMTIHPAFSELAAWALIYAPGQAIF